MNPRKFRSAGATHRGRVRLINEDAFLIDEELGLFVVADGVGGRAKGEVASTMAVEETHGYIRHGRPILERFLEAPHPKRLFSVKRLVESAVTWTTKTARVSPALRTSFPDQLQVLGSEGLVHQIIINLLQNAIDAMGEMEQPRLEIAIRQQGERVRVVVRDHGPGIPEEHLLQIFDPFFTTKEVGQGTGLGLYISYGLATEQCGGGLSARNHPQGGAEFTLELPLEMGEVRDEG